MICLALSPSAVVAILGGNTSRCLLAQVQSRRNRMLITTPACYHLFQAVDRERVELLLSGKSTHHRSVEPTKTSLWNRVTHADDSKRRAKSAAGLVPVDDTSQQAIDSRVEPTERDASEEIEFLLDRAACGVGKEGNGRWRIRSLASLARVLTGRRYLHSAEQLRASYPTDDVARVRTSLSDAAILLIRLGQIESHESQRLHAVINDRLKTLEADRSLVDGSIEGLRVLMSSARRLVDDAEDSRLERAAEDQRRVLWLVFVGLMVIFAFGITGHREVLFYGALGGILAPLTTRWQRNDDDHTEKLRIRADADAEYVKSWGVLLLGPVAGALAAYAGLLLLGFLSSPELSIFGERT